MKKRTVLLLLIFFGVFHLTAQTGELDSLFVRANRLYAQKNYTEAGKLYRKILERGYHSPELYYNLGNTAYKENSIPEAIYYYEKALKYNPSLKDARENLQIARRFVKTDIQKIPEDFLTKILRKITGFLSPDSWAKTALLFLLLAFLSFVVFLFTADVFRKRGAFYGLVVFLFLFLYVWGSAHYQHRLHAQKEAIVMQEGIPAYTEPDLSAEKVMVLPPGLKVNLLEETEEWDKIKLPNGKTVWIQHGSLKKI